MGRAHSLDLRERVLEDYDSGVGPVDLARKYRVARSSVYDWIQRRRESGSIAPKKGKVGRKPALLKQYDRLRKLVADRPDATLQELSALISPKVSQTTVWRTLAELKLSLKKSHPRGRTKPT